MAAIRAQPISRVLLTGLLDGQVVAVVCRFVESIDRIYRILMVLKIDEGVLILHHNVSNGTAGVENFLKIISCRASRDASDINLCELWVVRFPTR